MHAWFHADPQFWFIYYTCILFSSNSQCLNRYIYFLWCHVSIFRNPSFSRSQLIYLKNTKKQKIKTTLHNFVHLSKQIQKTNTGRDSIFSFLYPHLQLQTRHSPWLSINPDHPHLKLISAFTNSQKKMTDWHVYTNNDSLISLILSRN